jgi:hypothetical protein
MPAVNPNQTLINGRWFGDGERKRREEKIGKQLSAKDNCVSLSTSLPVFIYADE